MIIKCARPSLLHGRYKSEWHWYKHSGASKQEAMWGAIVSTPPGTPLAGSPERSAKGSSASVDSTADVVHVSISDDSDSDCGELQVALAAFAKASDS